MEKKGLRAALLSRKIPATACLAFGDELLCGLLGTVRRVWAPRGYTIRQVVQQQRQYQYLHLAVAPATGQLWWQWAPRMDGAAVAAAVTAWQAAGVAALVWDNAGSHKATQVAAVGVPLIPLPPYAPELNPAERLFQELRRVCEGPVYTTLAEKIAVVEQELQRWAADPTAVRQLCNWDWIRKARKRTPKQRT